MDAGDWGIVALIALFCIGMGSLFGIINATENETTIIPDNGCLTVVYKDNRLLGQDNDLSGYYCKDKR